MSSFCFMASIRGLKVGPHCMVLAPDHMLYYGPYVLKCGLTGTPNDFSTSSIIRCCVLVQGRPGERNDAWNNSRSCVRSTRSATKEGASYVVIRTRLWSMYMLRLVCLNSASPPTRSTIRSSTTAVSHAYSRKEYTIAWYSTKCVDVVPSARRALTDDGWTSAG